MKYTLLHYLDYCKCTQPFTLNVDYLRVRIPATDALEIIKNMLVINDMSGLAGHRNPKRTLLRQ